MKPSIVPLMRQLSPRQLQELLGSAESRPVLLDVREIHEYRYCRIGGSLHMPMSEIPARFGEMSADANIVVICHHGIRSHQVALFLEEQGFTDVANLAGGIHRWANEVDPTMPRY